MHFDPTINLGSVITIGLLCIAALKWFRRIPAAIKQLQEDNEANKEWIKDHQECNERQAGLLAALGKDVAYLRGVSDAQAQHPSSHLKDRY